jgi:hypothetical protein
MYFSQGLYSQAIYALEEVLVLQPNAWNVRPSFCSTLQLTLLNPSAHSRSMLDWESCSSWQPSHRNRMTRPSS